MERVRAKSLKLTGYLMELLADLEPRGLEIITPRVPEERGCQVSLKIAKRPRELLKDLHGAGVVCDFREPDVIRAAPVPFYNRFHDVWRFATELRGLLSTKP